MIKLKPFCSIFIILVAATSGLVGCWSEKTQENKESQQVTEKTSIKTDSLDSVQLEEVKLDNQSEVNLSDVNNLIAELQTESDIQALQMEVKKESIYEEDRISAKVISELLAKSFNQNVKTRLTPEEQSCYGRIHYGFAITDIDVLLRRQLSARDFNALNEFNRSPLGQKVTKNKHTDYLFERSGRGLSNQEQKMLRKFKRTKEGQYLNSLSNNVELIEILKKRTQQKLESCGVSDYDKNSLYRLR